MRTLVLATIATAALAGCASSESPTPNQVLNKDESLHYMSRAEVIQATQQCQDSKMRPNVIYTGARVSGQFIEVPIDVQCSPMPVTYYRPAPPPGPTEE